jgi:hypothetical protein
LEFLENEKGSASVGYLVLLPFLLFFLLIVPDLLRLGGTYLTVHNIAKTGISLMEKHGGMNQVVAQDMADWINRSRLELEKIEVITDDYAVPYGDPMTLVIKTKVPMIAFRWVGMNVEVPIEVTKVGISKAVGPLLFQEG